MASQIWPSFMCEPEYTRELEQAEEDALAQVLEDHVTHLENVRLGFEEDAA